MVQDFRFGIGVQSVKSAQKLRDTVRRFEDLGFDVLHVPDHLGRFGIPAPFPTMVAAAEYSKTMRVGTFVINAAFYKPAVLARDAMAVDVLSEGREAGGSPAAHHHIPQGDRTVDPNPDRGQR